MRTTMLRTGKCGQKKKRKTDDKLCHWRVSLRFWQNLRGEVRSPSMHHTSSEVAQVVARQVWHMPFPMWDVVRHSKFKCRVKHSTGEILCRSVFRVEAIGL
jgi:hypothetical protein